jgi:Fe-S-cluster containining protein
VKATSVTANSECRRCGTCCIKGGPVLHKEDRQILLDGTVGHHHLVTIRKGELVLNPVTRLLESYPRELIKVRGNGKEWTCCFFHENQCTCRIYENRFLECRALKCWDTRELEKIIGRKTLERADLINADDPVLELIRSHEEKCPCEEVHECISLLSVKEKRRASTERLTMFVRRDISIRRVAREELSLEEKFEPFLFGRTLQEIIQDRGYVVRFPEDV